MAWSKRGILTLCYPVEKGGLIKNNDDYEKLLHEAFYNEMRVAPEEHAVVMMLSANAPYAQRSKVVQIMFETFNTPALLCVSEDVAALYPARDGIVVKSGHSGTVVSMVRNGRSVRESVVTLSMGGEAVSTRLRQMLEAEYGADASSVTFELLEEIKAKLCYVSPVQYEAFKEAWLKEPSSITLEAPDGFKFSLGLHVFDAPEYVFFQQEHLGRAVAECISRGGGLVGEHVLLIGKNSLFPGLADRLAMELRVLGVPLSMAAPPNRAFLAYTNVSGQMGIFNEDTYVRKERYDEFGPDDVVPHFDTISFS